MLTLSIQVLAYSVQYMSIIVTLPAFLTFGTFQALISSKPVSADYPSYPISASIFVQDSNPTIVSVEPSYGSNFGGDIVSFLIQGFPAILFTDYIKIYFGGEEASSISVRASDYLSTFLSSSTPPTPTTFIFADLVSAVAISIKVIPS